MTNQTKHLATRTAKTAIIGLPVWCIQYFLVVPAAVCVVIALALLKFAFKTGILGILLFCLPIIGWVMLWFMRQSRLRHEELLAAVRRPHDKSTQRSARCAPFASRGSKRGSRPNVVGSLVELTSIDGQRRWRLFVLAGRRRLTRCIKEQGPRHSSG